MRSRIWIVKRPIHDFSILISHLSSTCVGWVPEILLPVWCWLFIQWFSISQGCPSHMHTNTHTYSSRSLNCIYTHIQEKEVLMSSFCHYEVVIQQTRSTFQHFGWKNWINKSCYGQLSNSWNIHIRNNNAPRYHTPYPLL